MLQNTWKTFEVDTLSQVVNRLRFFPYTACDAITMEVHNNRRSRFSRKKIGEYYNNWLYQEKDTAGATRHCRRRYIELKNGGGLKMKKKNVTSRLRHTRNCTNLITTFLKISFGSELMILKLLRLESFYFQYFLWPLWYSVFNYFYNIHQGFSEKIWKKITHLIFFTHENSMEFLWGFWEALIADTLEEIMY